MINIFSQKLGELFVKWGISDVADIEIYIFGFESIIMRVVHCLTMVGIGTLVKRPIETIVFLVFYSSVRKIAGGQHFKSKNICFGFSGMLICMVMIPINIVDWEILRILSNIIFMPSIIIIYLLAPCDNEGKRINDKEKQNLRGKIQMLLLINIIIYLIFMKINWIGEYIISTCMFIEGMGIVKEKYKD